MGNTVIIILAIFAVLLLLGFSLVLYQVVRRQERHLGGFLHEVERNLDYATKLLEVRDFHDFLRKETDEMLAAAYAAGDRPQQERIQKIQERLETMRARTLEKTMALLGTEDSKPKRVRRKRQG